MKLADHCRLCEHQVVELWKGTFCGLTNDKPNFLQRCQSAFFDEKAIAYIKEINIEYETLRKEKWTMYLYLVVFTSISLLVMYMGFSLSAYIYEYEIIEELPFIIIGAGFSSIYIPIATIVKYRNELKIATEKKAALDQVLSAYELTYEIEFDFKRFGTTATLKLYDAVKA